MGDAAAGTQNILMLKVLPEGDDPTAVKFAKAFEQRFPDLARQGRPTDLGDVLGYGGAQVFIEALKRAGPGLTQQALVKALESLKDFENPLILPTTLSPTRHEGNQSARVVQVQTDLSRKILNFDCSRSA